MKIVRKRYVPPVLRDAELEPDEVLARLIEEHRSVPEVAATLGVNPATVYRWMHRFGVQVVRQDLSRTRHDDGGNDSSGVV